jgi:hypothetical protein
MKKIVFKKEKMPFKSSYKLKIKLYSMILKKKMKNIISFNWLKLAIPALALGIFAIWFIHINLDSSNWWDVNNLVYTENTNISTVNDRIEQIWTKYKVQKYENIAKKRIVRAKMQRYKHMALVRKIKARQTN